MKKVYKLGKRIISLLVSCMLLVSMWGGITPALAAIEEDEIGPNGYYYAYVPHTPNAPATTYAFETPKEGIVDIEFDVTPLTEIIDGHIAFNTVDYVMGYTSERKININLKNNGQFAANDNAAMIEPEIKIPYEKDKTYHFVLSIDITKKTYSATVDGNTLATNYAFRSKAPVDIKNIGVMGVVALDGSFKVTNISEKLVELVDNDTIGMDEADNPAINGELKIYKVGPTHKYKKVQDVLALLQPGDTVEVDGDATYPAPIFVDPEYDGTKDKPITIEGISINGNRPIIKTLNATNMIEIGADNYIFDNFEVIGNLNEVLAKYSGVTYKNIMEQSSGVRKEISNKTVYRGIFHKADNLVVSNCIIHDARMGILGADEGSGSITVEYCDIYHNGTNSGQHNLYLSADEVAYPVSIARVQYNYIHDANTGNGLKTRARRNEVYFNWFENNYYQSLELIGPDPGFNEDEAEPAFATAESIRGRNPEYGEFFQREDSDVVGNVIIHDRASLVRVGGDGTSDMSLYDENYELVLGEDGRPVKVGPSYGQTYGRYRFVNNTFIHYEDDTDEGTDPRQAIRIEFGVESVELYNNVFYKPFGRPMSIISENIDPDIINKANWASGNRQVKGANNWVQTGSLNVPEESEWIGTITGTTPGFVDARPGVNNFNLRPDSPLIEAGIAIDKTVATWPNWSNTLYDFTAGVLEDLDFATYVGTPVELENIDNAFPNPLMKVDFHPVNPEALTVGLRPKNDKIDIGAFEGPKPTEKEWVITDNIKIKGSGHIQGLSSKTDNPGVYEDKIFTLGTVGQSRRLEGFTLELEGSPSDMMLVYRIHIKKYEDRPNDSDAADTIWKDNQGKLWEKSGNYIGTKGESKRIEGIEVKLINKNTGEEYKGYKIQYQVHMKQFGWGTGEKSNDLKDDGKINDSFEEWVENGIFAGTNGQNRCIEAIRIRILKEQ